MRCEKVFKTEDTLDKNKSIYCPKCKIRSTVIQAQHPMANIPKNNYRCMKCDYSFEAEKDMGNNGARCPKCDKKMYVVSSKHPWAQGDKNG